MCRTRDPWLNAEDARAVDASAPIVVLGDSTARQLSWSLRVAGMNVTTRFFDCILPSLSDGELDVFFSSLLRTDAAARSARRLAPPCTTNA